MNGGYGRSLLDYRKMMKVISKYGKKVESVDNEQDIARAGVTIIHWGLDYLQGTGKG